MSKQIVIAGNQEGLDKRNQPYLIPDGAYPLLYNAFNRRQRILKKRGHLTQGRLRRCFTTLVLAQGANANPYTITDLLSDANVTAFGVTTVRVDQPNAEIQPFRGPPMSPQLMITVGVDVFLDLGNGFLSGGGGGSTIDYVSGQINLNFTFAPAPDPITITFCYYPLLPVMGIAQREVIAINFEETVAFDQRYAYITTPGGWAELSSTTPTVWSAGNFNLFWWVNYRGEFPQTQNLWVTNNVDPIRYYDGVTWNPIPFLPLLFGVTVLNTALLITPFKGRLLVFNTTEGGVVFRQRCRYSQSALVGPPTNLVTGWLQTPQGPGFIDAPTAEAIISVQNLKDRLIVYFERSTWELVYTGNESLPFYFRQINRELGSESTFSVIPFDGGVLGIGNVGVHACNGTNVTRIDEKIPDQIYEIQNDENGPQRVSGARDYVEEVVYWTYPEFDSYDTANDNQIYPNRVLLYNYIDANWAILDESFTTYGSFQRSADDTWDTLPWLTWDAWDTIWNSGLMQSRVPNILAGNQQGFTFLINNESSSNAISRTVHSFPFPSTIQSVDHNMVTGDYFTISDAIGVVLAFNSPFDAAPYNYTPALNSFRVTQVLNSNRFEFDGNATGTYLGGGEITVLSNFNISSKEFNSFFPLAQSMRLPYADIIFDRKDNGEVSIYFYLNNNQVNSNQPLAGTSAIPTSARNAFQLNQDSIWYRKFVNAVGQFIQYEIRHSKDEDSQTPPQMRRILVAQEDFVLNGVVLTVDPSGRLAP